MKTLVLVGSGEFTEAMIETDDYLINMAKRRSGTNKINVAIIPTASVPDGRQKRWIEDGIKHYQKLGVRGLGINVTNRKEANRKTNLARLKNAAFIYFSGGHPGFLFRIFSGTKAGSLILDMYKNGAILAGASAGAMIMGDFLLANAQEAFDKKEKPEWIRGFGLVPYSIIPHYDWAKKHKPELLKKIINSRPGKISQNFLGIDENTALIIRGRETKIMGKGKIRRI